MNGNDVYNCVKCGSVIKEIPYEKIERLQNLIITTTNCVEGYRIVKYMGIVSGESALGTSFLADFTSGLADFTGSSSKAYSSKLGNAKTIAINKMQAQAVQIGADAVVGVDIDILNTDSNMFIACANGTAVKIEKI